MSGVAVEIVDRELNAALQALDGIANAPRQELADGLGRLVQEQTRRRIEIDKTSPDGEGWKPNYAGTSILYKSGALAGSIDYVADDDSVIVGSGLVYARIHQLGGKIVPKNGNALVFAIGNSLVSVKSVTMPARPYFGLSSENRADVLDAAADWLEGLLQ
mgnify:FL=1|tara:strand:- start:28842 stop:29321 length:480 start_codon:yes stop_codon:yes gene_type:complete